MWGAIAGTVLSGIGSIFGSAASARAERKRKHQIEKDEQENENWYNRRYNEDVTQRSDAQRILTQAEDAIKKRNKAAAGKQAVMGGTEESVAATKAANAEGEAKAIAQIAAQGDKSKYDIEQQYLKRKNALDDQLAGIEEQRAQNIATAVGGVTNAASGLLAYSAEGGKKKSDTTDTAVTRAVEPSDVTNTENLNINSTGAGLNIGEASDANSITNPSYDSIRSDFDLAKLADEENKLQNIT